MTKNLKKNLTKKLLKIWKKHVLKCLRLHICVLYNVIVLTDKVLIVHLNLHLDVSEGICAVKLCMEKLFLLWVPGVYL